MICGFLREENFRNVERALIDVEFEQPRARSQVAEISEQITQPERRVNIFRVERGEDDVRHHGTLTEAAQRGKLLVRVRDKQNPRG